MPRSAHCAGSNVSGASPGPRASPRRSSPRRSRHQRHWSCSSPASSQATPAWVTWPSQPAARIRSANYYQQVFDARLSDWIEEKIAGVGLLIKFLRVNERHHTVAVAGVRGLSVDPIRTTVQHLNTQVESLDDLLAAYERVIDLGFHMQWSVGQHTNDRQLSFYCVTPSGFEWELGWNPIIVTPEMELTWAPRTYQGISIWGHTPIGENVISRLGQFRTAVASLRRDEPALAVLS
ncbi:MAG: VOC family protein [Candidatus Nanopelagicales bacterium]